MAGEIELATGVVLLSFGLSFVLNPGYWATAFRKMFTTPENTFTMFLVLLVLGIVVVRSHNLWVGDWRVIVTITGWGLLLKSIVVLLVPSTIDRYAKWTDGMMGAWVRFGGAVWLVAGATVTVLSWP